LVSFDLAAARPSPLKSDAQDRVLAPGSKPSGLAGLKTIGQGQYCPVDFIEKWENICWSKGLHAIEGVHDLNVETPVSVACQLSLLAGSDEYRLA
jgi:hypothetical protein